jgi:hypothetical protein
VLVPAGQRASTAAGDLASAAGDLASRPMRRGKVPGERVSRASRLSPDTRIVHADLHNHTLISDGEGEPARAFDSMRAAGLDVAAITDHAAVAPETLTAEELATHPPPDSIDPVAWRYLRELADEANEDGAFVSLRGFEWSHPWLGHVNVWFSQDYLHPRETANPSAAPLWRWLADRASGTPSSRLPSLAGFNHPGREPGRFAGFAFDSAIAPRLVSFEIFNRTEDYLFEGTDAGWPSPLVECLEAGWRPGLTGVSDEHSARWGFEPGKGRTGLHVRTLTRAGVHAALLERRCFATRLQGLRLDAVARRTPMGGQLAHGRGPVRFQLDLDRGPGWWGRPLLVQVLRPGRPLPVVAESVEVRVPRPDQPALGFDVGIDAEEGSWVVLRVTDPAEPADPRSVGEFRAAGDAVAYTSPFYLVPPLSA